MPTAPVTQMLSLTCLTLLLLQRETGVGAQSWTFRLQQPQEQLSAMAGETITLNCTISGEGPPGPVEWLKGWGSENKTIYAPTMYSRRVTRVEDGSNEDFSIQIRDVQPEDAGTYYCVKFMRSGRPGAGLQVLQHGKGTVVSVQGLTLLASPGLWFVILLEKGLLGGLLIFLFRRIRT